MAAFSKARRAEAAVSGLLRQQGWHICARNYRGRGFEIDILALDSEGTLLMGEVKFRKSFNPETCIMQNIVSSAQLQRIKKGALRYIDHSSIEVSYLRIDLFVVTGSRMQRLYRYSHIQA